MSVDIIKQLDRAKRYVEKNRLAEAIEAYHSVLEAVPNHIESTQALGDLYTLQNRADRAAVYYGMLFDRFTTPREETKALVLYTRFLKPHQQPPARVVRYALLLQKQNRPEEAIEQLMSAPNWPSNSAARVMMHWRVLCASPNSIRRIAIGTSRWLNLPNAWETPRLPPADTCAQANSRRMTIR